MSVKLSDLLGLAAIVLTVGLAFSVYSEIPDPMPTRWSPVTGEAAGFVARPGGVVLLASMPVIAFVLLKLSASVFAARLRIDASRKVLDTLTALLTLCLAAAAVAGLLAASGKDVPMPFVMRFVIGSALMVAGNYMGKVRKNFLLGVRTPWTLANAEVWGRTQRMAGWTMAIIGLVIVSTAWQDIRPPIGLIVAMALVASLMPFVYSFVVYRRLDSLGQARRDSR